MSTSAPNEAQMKETLAVLAKSSVSGLKGVFTTPPADKTWEEIEAGMSQGKSLKDICGIADARMEDAYAEGKRKLEMEDFEGAKEIFSNLCLYDQQTPKYWGGLAKTCEGLEHYPEAIDCYKMMALVTGGSEPLPYLCMGYCYLSLNDKKSALDVLELGNEVADPFDSENRGVLDLIDKMLDICKQ